MNGLTPFVADLIGFAGSFVIVAAFAYSNMARRLNLLAFNLANFVGAALLAVSLTVNYNLPTMVLEIVWMIIALFGIGRALRTRFPSPTDEGDPQDRRVGKS